MVDRRESWLLLPQPVRRLPADLAAVVVLTALTLAAVFVPVVDETPLRVGFGLIFVLFLPGYAFIAALFPEAGSGSATDETDDGSDGTTVDDDDSKPRPVPGTEAADERRTAAENAGSEPSGSGAPDRSGIDGVERVALSFGLSIAIVPLIGLVLNFTPWGIRLAPVATSVAGVTLVCVAVAARRRWELPPDERFAVPYRDWIATGKREAFDPDDRTDAALNVVLVVSVLLAVGSVGYAVAVPPQGEQFTELYLLTEDPDGELVADGYPETMSPNESAELIVGIGNNEYETTEYSVVVQLQEAVTEGNETTVVERTRLDRFEATVSHNETHHEPHTLRPTRTGENLRVQYLLYDGEVPDEPTEENAYREVHLWIDVEPESSNE
ncbi:DUF1616 domain-containing protein [Halorubrum lipolyticum]|uniref:DUF1616 domain-containing protein n=1 Tax=Halorubrum lipolyticum DSM 21995 TaxID=1227482 RepID=M0NLD8_9EURY|nr:DUF1616 domain-containing protein [Halorubrum lipolyticum]EMA58403.1 hypothetical protein C469_13210 [Halorubrum lipolyticum DSM 21995]